MHSRLAARPRTDGEAQHDAEGGEHIDRRTLTSTRSLIIRQLQIGVTISHCTHNTVLLLAIAVADLVVALQTSLYQAADT